MRNSGRIPLLFLFAFSVFSLSAVPKARPAEAPPGKRVGVLIDNYPFSFRNEQGRIEGFAYELTQEIERVMGLKFIRVEGGTKEINAAFREGTLDLLQSYAQFPERDQEAEFSVPYLTMAGAILVRAGDRRVGSIEDLRGLHVAVHRGSLGETILRRAGLESSIVTVASVEETLEQVSHGTADATLVGRLTGLTLAQHLGLTNLRLVDGDVPGYQVRYCLAVRHGDHALLAHVNEGLAILVRTGRFDEIYRKWFGKVQPVGYTALQVALAISIGLALALAVSLWAVVRLRRLQSHIVRQKEELRASEEWHRAIFDGAHDGLIVLERAPGEGGFDVRQINASGLKLLNLAEAPMPRTPLRSLLGADAELVEKIEAVATHEGTCEFEYERAANAGWWRLAVGPLAGCTLVSFGDITEAVRVRQQLRVQEQRLLQNQKLEAIGTLAGGIAHDFNNVLTSIIGNTELCLLSLPADRPEMEDLRHVLDAAGRARQLVRQILMFSRRHEATRQPILTTPIIKETIGFLKSAARGAIEFESRRNGSIPAIMADAAQVHQVLMNIGTNAIHAMRGMTGGRVTFLEELVELTADEGSLAPGQYVLISIHDNGPGIPPDIIGRIFEPFFSTKPPGEGTGLGLSVVHGIMQQHGGAVTVRNQPIRGARFDLYFPVAAAPADAAALAPAIIPHGNNELILLVDDDADGVRTMRDILTQLGYRVAAFRRPGDALAEFIARRKDFALVLTDLTMPGLNGLQLIAQIRGSDPDKPIILASGFFSEHEEREAEKLHVTRLLHKPMTVLLLGDAVAACLAAPAEAAVQPAPES